MLQQTKKVTNKNSKGKKKKKKKKKKKPADFIGEGLGIFLHMPQFSLVVSGSMIRKNHVSYLVVSVFSGLLMAQHGPMDLGEAS